MFNKNKVTDFASLIESLQFKQSFDESMFLVAGHMNDVKNRLCEFLSSGATPNEICEHALKLPQENLLRLITSPYLCEYLMLWKDESTNTDAVRIIEQQIIQALVAEIKYANPGFEYSLSPQWTINGDIVLDTKIRESFPALQTSCGVQLNYQSYVHNTGKEGIGGYSYKAAMEHKERIETGKSIVQATSSSALSMIESFTTIIQFRQNSERPNVVNSSTHTSIGLIRCDNFHELHSDMPEIVDLLVHESIHQYLHLFEEQLFPFVKEESIEMLQAQTIKFPSPWSGNLIDFRSYTHAILVWYGLVHFWSQFIESGIRHEEVTTAQAEEKLSEALFGFVNSQSVLDNLGEHVQFLDRNYVQHIERIQNAIKMKRAV